MARQYARRRDLTDMFGNSEEQLRQQEIATEVVGSGGASLAFAMCMPDYGKGSNGWVTDSGDPNSHWLSLGVAVDDSGGWTFADHLGMDTPGRPTGAFTALVPPAAGVYVFGWSGDTDPSTGAATLCVLNNTGGVWHALDGGAYHGPFETRGSSGMYRFNGTTTYGIGINLVGAVPTAHNWNHHIWAHRVA